MSRAQPRTLLEQLVSESPYTWQEIETRFAERARVEGERVSISWRQLQRIAAGEIGRPRPAVARVLIRLFGHPVDELLGPPSDVEFPALPAVGRREFLAAVAAASVGAAAPESFARLLDGIDVGSVRRVGMSDVAAVEAAADTFMSFDLARSGELARSFARHALAWSTELLDLEMNEPTRQRLSSAVALLSDRLGWSLFDSGDGESAGRTLTFALDHAARGADADLRAHVMLDLSTVMTDSGHPADGVDILRAALGDERISPAERANLHAVCARHCAAADQQRAGLRHVGLAEEALTTRDTTRGPDWARHITYGPGHHDSALGLALFALGDTRARHRLEAARAGLERGRTRTGLRCQIRLAVLDLQAGDRAAAEEAGHAVMGDATGVTSGRIRRDLLLLRKHAAERGVDELAGELTSLISL